MEPLELDLDGAIGLHRWVQGFEGHRDRFEEFHPFGRQVKMALAPVLTPSTAGET